MAMLRSAAGHRPFLRVLTSVCRELVSSAATARVSRAIGLVGSELHGAARDDLRSSANRASELRYFTEKTRGTSQKSYKDPGRRDKS